MNKFYCSISDFITFKSQYSKIDLKKIFDGLKDAPIFGKYSTVPNCFTGANIKIIKIEQRDEVNRILNPSISKEEFYSLGFRQLWHSPNKNHSGTWSVSYQKNLNPLYYFDVLEISWFCGTNRYTIYRQTNVIRNIPCFDGFMNSIKDLQYLLTLFDYRQFYKHERQRSIL